MARSFMLHMCVLVACIAVISGKFAQRLNNGHVEEAAKDAGKKNVLHTPVVKPASTGTLTFSMFRETVLGPVAQDTVITYGTIESDINANIEAQSLFRAPVPGTYVISYQFYGNSVTVQLHRRRDSVSTVVSQATAGDGSANAGSSAMVTSGGTVILDLLVNDELFTVLPGGSSDQYIHGTTNREISFSGFLLYQRLS